MARSAKAPGGRNVAGSPQREAVLGRAARRVLRRLGGLRAWAGTILFPSCSPPASFSLTPPPSCPGVQPTLPVSPAGRMWGAQNVQRAAHDQAAAGRQRRERERRRVRG